MPRDESRIVMTRGDDALVTPHSIIDIARSVDRELAVDLGSAGRLAKRELDELRLLERASGRRVHKGHALHSIGVSLVAQDHMRARIYFHAAIAEDVRTYPDGAPEGWGRARQVLVELYGERVSAIQELEILARHSVSDPLSLAEAFEEEQGADLGIYVGLRASSRDEVELEGVRRERLVFVAGTHAFQHHMKALRDAVTDSGLVPVVVMEFPGRPDEDDYTKSERFMEHCGYALFDLSYLQGQMLELPMAVFVFGIPLYVGFIEGTVTGELHGTGMVRGLLGRAGAEPESVVNTEQLREGARAWLRKHARPGRALPGPSGVQFLDSLGPVGGTASPYGQTLGSNTPFVPEAPTAMSSGEGYMPETDGAAASAEYWASKLKIDSSPTSADTEPDDQQASDKSNRSD